MGTKNNPGKFDCYANAEDDEPMFILLGRDASASAIVNQWAEMRAMLIRLGVKPDSDWAMVSEARECAVLMEAYHRRRRDKQKAVTP